jgi:hypothetical protein
MDNSLGRFCAKRKAAVDAVTRLIPNDVVEVDAEMGVTQ